MGDVVCPDCEGAGEIQDWGDDLAEWVDCPRCDNSGFVADDYSDSEWGAADDAFA